MTEIVIGADGTVYREIGSRTGLIAWTDDSALAAGEVELLSGDVFLCRYKQAANLDMPVNVYTHISVTSGATGFYVGIYGAETNTTYPYGIATLIDTSANETALAATIGTKTIAVGTTGELVGDTLSGPNPVSRPNPTYHYIAWLATGLGGTLKIAAQVGLNQDLVNWHQLDPVFRACVLTGSATAFPATIDLTTCTGLKERGWAAISAG